MFFPSKFIRRLLILLSALFVVTTFFLKASVNVGSDSFENLTASPQPSELRSPGVAQEPLVKHIGKRILITGGGGNIGKHIVRRLLAQSIPVTVLDVIFHDDELQALRAAFPDGSSLLKVMIGDIRDPEALRHAMTFDISGVIHLAAISRVLWCVQNEPDCVDVNVRGTQLVVNALAALNDGDSGTRWFILASSREVYGNGGVSGAPISEDADKLPSNAYGSSKLKAEQVVERHIGSTTTGKMRAIALRLSNVYGGADDHVERLIPSVVTQAMSHQVIQIVGGEQKLDMLHIDDCVDAFMLAVDDLDQGRWSMFSSGRKAFDVFNIASGSLSHSRDLVDAVVSLTGSSSPLQFLPGDDRFPNVYRASITKATNVLGFKAKINVKQGVLQLVQAYLNKTEQYLAMEISSRCRPPLTVDLRKLDGCTVILAGSVGGQLDPIKPDQGYWTAIHTMKPDEEMQLHIDIRITSTGITKAVISEINSGSRLALPATRSARRAGVISLLPLGPSELTKGDVYEWDVTVHSETGTIRLVLPDSGLQLAPPLLERGNFSLVPQSSEHGLFRVTPVCCPAQGPWPFSKDNPMDFIIENQKTSTDRPFIASPAKALCSRLRRALFRVKGRRATLDAAREVALRPKYSAKPTEWIQDGRPACSNLCGHPTICVDTGDCQCVLSACVLRERFPFASLAHSLYLSYPPSGHTASEQDLAIRVKNLSWMTVLRPWAARYINSGARFPGVCVSPLDPDSAIWRKGPAKDIDKLQGGNCFSADTSLQRALSLIQTRAEDAEMTFVPHFHGRADGRILLQYEWSLGNVPSFTPEKAIIPFTHDWGQCLNFVWTIWERRTTPIAPRPASMMSMTAWSVMADLNTPCFRPHQDIIIPPRTCVSPALYQSFKDLSKVRPARERNVLVTFNGNMWGTWGTFRHQLVCPRTGWQALAANLNAGYPLSAVWGGMGQHTSYVSLLNDTIFCPLPGGTTGWATRLVDVLYSGCIPVIFGDSAQQPFFDIIDWSKISVRISLTDVDHLEEILLSRYTMDDIERFQANIMLVRDAFIYPLDDTKDQDVVRMMVNDRGPLFFALHSTGMRLATKWPTTAEYDRP